ncbi:Rpn family recombination-promoting nuclease/putative transposase [Alkalinema sp. FACHB-956]|uniref:Rpn family recombination-promoting nuclease/putative transposase n=1 Tax=Alkalinema sp. FACHB-956 TaxID=2692768 RepID=UPI0016843924|nr:Rpn family recombination-promoting nuclease/putative transposase [Alkalinema sp. FACHB-956]MBD2327648.1 Rpn family recombination-promoting nuclease/putative transposase [Alkalinema sp. FACHB-956]
MRRDSIFYKLFQQSPALLFDLLPEAPSNADAYKFDSIEVKETSFRIDGVFLPPDPSGVVFFAEVQFQHDPLLYERLVCEAALYFYRNRDRCRDWKLVAIYPDTATEQADCEPHQYLIDTGKLTRIYLDQVRSWADLSIGIQLMILTTLEETAAITAARTLVQQTQNDRAIIEMISTIMVYKFTNLTRDEVAAMIGITLENTPIYRSIFAEGEQAGEQHGGATVILKQLRRRFGELPEAIVTQISGLPIVQLEEMAELLLDWQNLQELVTWLAQAQGDAPAAPSPEAQ